MRRLLTIGHSYVVAQNRMLAHEMAHVARRDFLTNLFCELLSLPISFHPLTYLIKREIDRTRELACDELVTRRVLAPKVYARSLLWAADITQLTKNTYADCLRLWTEGLPFLSAEDREWILGRTAAEALRWPE